MENPLLLLVMIAGTLYLARLWLDDRRAALTGAAPKPGTFPGAASAPGRAYALAVAGALGLLAAETAGEQVLGIAGEQRTVTMLFGLSTLSAAFLEELVFRGYLVFDRRGRAVLWGGVLACSVLFAALHPFVWNWGGEGFVWVGGLKGWFSTGFAFAGSLWFYACRLGPWNPGRSLGPCFAAHAAKNAGVWAVKAGTGFVAGWW